MRSGGDAAAGRMPYFEALFASIDVGLCFMDASLGVVAANPAMARLMPGKVFDPDSSCPGTPGGLDGLCGQCLAAEALASGLPAFRVVEKTGPDGAVRSLETGCHPLVDPAGRIFGVAEIVRDVTRRVRAKRDMALASQDIEMLFDSIRSILVTLDGDNRIRRFNASAEAALGLQAGVVLDRDFFGIGLEWDGDSVARALERSRRTLSPVRVDEVRCRVPGVGERLLGLTVNPVPSPNGAPAGVLILGQELSDIKARELESMHERRMQSIGQLAAGIAHEINTPIQYIGYNAGFLDEAFADLRGLLGAYAGLAAAVAAGDRQGADVALARVRAVERDVDLAYLDREIPSAVANTRKGVGHVAEIVGAMRQMSHPGTGDRLFFDLNAAVRDIVTITRHAWKHAAEVELRLAPGLPPVYGLPQEVSQVLLNVVQNAAQAVAERAAAKPGFRGRIGIETASDPDGTTVTVADNGPGVDASIRHRVFDPFFTTKPVGQGTGQGLAISRSIMARHGGDIELAAGPDGGAVFRLRFPLYRGKGAD